MFKNITILFIYTLLLLVKDIYAIDLNIKQSDVSFTVHLDANMLVKKEKILITWNNQNIPINSTYTIDLLTNSTYDSKGLLTCDETYTIVNNLTTSYYKWKTIKLNKYNTYSFLVTVEGENIYGASKEIPYVPDFWKYIKKGNQTLYISNGRGENVFNKNSSTLGMVDSLPNSSNNDSDDIYYATIVVDQDGNIIDGDEEDIFKGKANNNNIDGPSKSIYNIVFTGLVISAAIVVMSVIVQRNRKIINEKKAKSDDLSSETLKDSYSEEFPHDFSFENKSDAAGSELLREKLKQEALEIERNKVLESMKEKNLTPEFNNNKNNYLSVATTEVVSNISNSNTDYSWHNMEVLTFSSPLNPGNTSNNNEKAGPVLSIPSLNKKEKFSDIHLDDESTKDITDTQGSYSSDKGCSSSDKSTLNDEKEPSIKINVV